MTDLAVHDGPILAFTMTDLAVHDGPIFAFTMVRNSQIEIRATHPNHPYTQGKTSPLLWECRHGHSLSLAPLLGALIGHYSGLGGSA